ncbi:MAG TPA: decaprenyl-phosphate phosphoribosyltransferase [Actinocrinis sp.]|uniref:decaprenyl-phosphate phosphoribosyltransferase n=1 Tax=Actinocrinis sp. TaxID=1920516 RepID=UPI002DDD533A|nr:decaprenyl-phosphate phosphoribosyltransferase [Actinocrinis sp.]HEV2346608.1 decaprenyl-phosphate phosphoribosyltransferase [Actinocrinis sp.]
MVTIPARERIEHMTAAGEETVERAVNGNAQTAIAEADVETESADAAPEEAPVPAANGTGTDVALHAPVATSAGSTSTKPFALLRAMVREARPKQWVKNVLVLTAPLAAGRIDEAKVLGASAVAFAAFCLAAAAVYYANDALDVEADRMHPKKRYRPIAAGLIPIPLAWATVVVLSIAAVGVAFAANVGTAAVIAIYLAMHLSYSAWFKHILVLDLALVAGGFLLRAMIGGVAANIPLSQWFLLTTAFGSLFMVAGKRHSEMILMGEAAATTRKTLAAYSESYLRFVWQMAAGLTILTYALWAFGLGQNESGVNWHEISIVPWSFIFLRYAMFVDSGKAGEPEDVLFGDVVIMAIAAIWLGCFAAGVFSAH